MFWERLQERETWEIKGDDFRVEGLWLGLSWEVLLGWETFVNTLCEWKSLSVLFIGEIEEKIEIRVCSLWACWS